jgi:rfaE bifunctional protein kinase chain/domain
MTKQSSEALVAQFAGTRVLVLGDAMVDAYQWGEVRRMSPEAPVPVVSIARKDQRLGGAANVALNLAALGANTLLCGVVGADEAGRQFKELLARENLAVEGIVVAHDRPTTIKTRVISGGKHVLRIDEESDSDLSDEGGFIHHLANVFNGFRPEVVILQDYNKGVLTPKVIQTVIGWCKKTSIPTVVDPKKKNFLAYQGVTLFKPNLKETREGLQMHIDPAVDSSLLAGAAALKQALEADSILMTLSEHGVLFLGEGGPFRQSAFPRHIVDVSGAGDTVVSVAALALAKGMGPETLTTLANLAGGLVCEQVGVVSIQPEALQLAWNQLKANPA